MRSLFSGKGVERLARKPVDRPLRVGLRPEPLVEPDRVLVPVQHCPLEAAATPIDGNLCEALEQSSTDARAAPSRYDEKVFEVEAGLREKR